MRRQITWRAPVLTLFLLFMIAPVIATALFSFATRWDRTIWPEDLTLAWWIKVTARSAFQRTLLNSIYVALATVVVSAVLVTPTACWAHLRLPGAKPWIELIAIVPFGLPGVVLALALIRFYSNVPLPLINTANLLVASYVVLTLPFMYRSVMNALEAIDARTLSEAAQSLGATGWRTLIFAIIPNILSGVVNGSLLAFSTVFAEFTLANLLIGTRFKTFPIYLVEFTRFDARQASALAVISFAFAWVVSLAILWIVGRSGRPSEVLAAR
ncbi:MAG: ABC transporter permease [Dongiaceae bacterium]|jgi:putative spermidine/putrescine transport system permease protein